MAPIAGIVWSYETIQEYISTKVSDKLRNIPEENIETPQISVAGPVLEALRFAGDEEDLRELYANLLANALDKNTKSEVHPSFVEIIKQISPQEALLLKFLSELETFPNVCNHFNEQTVSAFSSSGFSFNNKTSNIITNQVKKEFLHICHEFSDKLNLESTLDNYRRLKLVDIDTNTSQRFARGMMPSILSNMNGTPDYEAPDLEISYSESLCFTSYGISFVRICINDKSHNK